MLNKIITTGRLTADPILKTTQGGISTTSFSVAVERDFADKDGHRATDFFSIVAWRHDAEFICKHFFKGGIICIVGTLQNRNYQDKNDNKRTVTEIIVDKAYFGSSNRQGTRSDDTPALSEPPMGVHETDSSFQGYYEDYPLGED